MKLSPRQAAEYIGCSLSLIYDWCAEGLPHYRIGKRGRRGRIQIDTADLDNWLEQCRRVTATPTMQLKHIRC